jgi:hypothetical protein
LYLFEARVAMRPQSTATAPARCPLCVLGAVRVLLSKGHVGPAERVLEELPAAINLALASVARRAYGEGIEEGLLARPCQGRQKPARGRSAAGRTSDTGQGPEALQGRPTGRERAIGMSDGGWLLLAGLVALVLAFVLVPVLVELVDWVQRR